MSSNATRTDLYVREKPGRVRLVSALLTSLLLSVSAPASAQSGAAPGSLSATGKRVEEGTVEAVNPLRTLSLIRCFALAESMNREVKVARKNLPLAAFAIKAAGAVPNPQIYLQAGFGDSFQYVFDGQTQQAGVIQQFQTAGKRSKKIALARANLALAELQLEALCFDVHNRVRRAYAELAAAEAYADLVAAQRDVALKLVQIARRRFQNGKAPKAEVLQAELNVLQFDTQRNQSVVRLEQASTALSLLIGELPGRVEIIDVDDNGLFRLASEKSTIVPNPRKSLPALRNLASTAYGARLDLAAARQQVLVNQRTLSLARTKKVPDLFLGGGTTYSTFTQHQPAGLSNTGNWIGTGGYFTVSAENPIFYRYQGEVAKAAADCRQSQRRVDLLKSQISADLVCAYAAVEVAQNNVFEYQNELLPTARSVASLARRGYQVGAADLTSAIIAQQQYQQTLVAYFEQVVAYQKAWADLERAVGAPLSL